MKRQTEQRKRRQDSIKEWTGIEGNSILRKAENHEEWRKLVGKIYGGAPTVSQTTGQMRVKVNQVPSSAAEDQSGK